LDGVLLCIRVGHHVGLWEDSDNDTWLWKLYWRDIHTNLDFQGLGG
jgi:hypothetical protein